MSIDDLVENLRSATGESRAVVAVFVDVRGFTRFAGIAESVDVAVFLRKFYVAVLSDYLTTAAFAKTTGDGLMVIIEYAESDVRGCGRVRDIWIGRPPHAIPGFPCCRSDDHL